MTSKTSKILISLAALFLSTQASAALITDTQVVNEHVSWLELVSWTHNLNDNPEPFALGSATSATLTIQFYDDSRKDGSEYSAIVVGLLDFLDDTIVTATSNWSTALAGVNLNILNLSGMLEVSVVSLKGDFRIGNSILEVTTGGNGNSGNPTRVPEPTTLFLFGAGLLGLGLVRLKHKS